IRLVNGINDREGRVEVLYGGQWGTICSDGWDVLDAAVVCRMHGYMAVKGTSQTPTDYGAGSGSIFLRGVQCDGNEPTLSACQLQGWNITECNHNEDAAVICLGE
ncbi:hypothetical protein HELRODRAFT_146256, partial [Helobdella robusta]|uniref:SRCR domain-containing protein n=1 Tax=Helobdella robusta TaxID=6412 RepID=T1EJR4_HELRO